VFKERLSLILIGVYSIVVVTGFCWGCVFQKVEAVVAAIAAAGLITSEMTKKSF
jgi:hypothetical protein